METQRIINLLNVSGNENSQFSTKKWYIIVSESKFNYLKSNKFFYKINRIKSL